MSTFEGKRFGFLGAGMIAEVFIRRLIASGTATPEYILVHDINGAILERLAVARGVRAMGSNADVAAECDLVFVAVPPLAALPVLREVAAKLRRDQIVISMAAAVSTALIEAAIGKAVPVVRLVPNTPSWIGQGMNPYCLGSHVGPAEKDVIRELHGVFGMAVEIAEERMSIATALTAVGPTYIFPVIAALADAAVAHGLPPGLALSAVCQVVSGAANLARETGRSPEGLSLMISTRTLDETAAKKLFMQAMEDAYVKILAAEAKIGAADSKA